MNQAEASGSDDDMDEEREEQVMDELAAAVLEEELGTSPLPDVDSNVRREQDIMAEVARRRQERDADATRKKSDAIFARFDVDRDGLLNFNELRALGLATGGDLPRVAYTSICQEIGADPNKGVTKSLLLTMYTDAALGDAHRDYNLIFARD